MLRAMKSPRRVGSQPSEGIKYQSAGREMSSSTIKDTGEPHAYSGVFSSNALVLNTTCSVVSEYSPSLALLISFFFTFMGIWKLEMMH